MQRQRERSAGCFCGSKMTYQQALNYLYNLERFGVRLGLKNIKKIVKLLDNPQDKLNIIHIAGSNGKGVNSRFYGFHTKRGWL